MKALRIYITGSVRYPASALVTVRKKRLRGRKTCDIMSNREAKASQVLAFPMIGKAINLSRRRKDK
jgi:hypothetical protein